MSTNPKQPAVTTRQGSVTQTGAEPIFHLDGKQQKVKVIKRPKSK